MKLVWLKELRASGAGSIFCFLTEGCPGPLMRYEGQAGHLGDYVSYVGPHVHREVVMETCLQARTLRDEPYLLLSLSDVMKIVRQLFGGHLMQDGKADLTQRPRRGWLDELKTASEQSDFHLDSRIPPDS